MENFRIEVPDADLLDLHERLGRTRWAPRSPAPDWVQGTPLDYLQELVDYWAGSYDWRSAEARLNSYQQYLA
jgi:epoxide hydrolase